MASAYEKRPGQFYPRWRDGRGVWQDTATRARTKREARRIAEELEQQAWRQRMGLEPVRAADGGGTVRELMSWWMEAFSEGNPSHAKNEATIRCRLLSGSLAEVLHADLTKGRIESFLDEKGATPTRRPPRVSTATCSWTTSARRSRRRGSSRLRSSERRLPSRTRPHRTHGRAPRF